MISNFAQEPIFFFSETKTRQKIFFNSHREPTCDAMLEHSARKSTLTTESRFQFISKLEYVDRQGKMLRKILFAIQVEELLTNEMRLFES